ncbi:MAG TPA: AsmA-like C-terminal region-containing protein, partial [Acetobacteraceae bacterium]|nr:AsmA-like C-terminal region-containing protein [Acetobacteraceae bacterium]
IAADTRDWVMQNIQAGTAHDGRADLVLDSPDRQPDVKLVSATGTLEGDGVAVTWMPNAPRVEQAKTHLVLTDPDKLEIDVRTARQVVRTADPIAIPSGHITITGLSVKDQFAFVQCEADGSIASAIALLKDPAVKVLDRHPLDLRAPSGDARVTIHAMIPLEKNLSIDEVELHATANLTKAHLSGIAAGRDLDDGTLLLDVDTNHLSVKGTGRLAGIQAAIDGMMDFRSGPPTQVLQRFQATGRVTAQQLSDAGLDTGGALAGEVGLTAVLNEYRNGDGEVTADADLTQAALDIGPLAWRKPVGAAAKASARLLLVKDKLTSIEPITIDGAGLQVAGAATVADGKPDTVRLERVVLGRTDVKGMIRLPPNGPINVDLIGPSLDVAAKLQEKSPKRDPAAPPPPPGPAWSMRGRFDRVYLAHDQIANDVAAAGDSDGRVVRALAITGKGGAGKLFSFRIGQDPVAPGPGRPVRRLSINAEDAGSFLQGLDVTGAIKGGELSVGGEFDDTTPRHTLSGALEIIDFRVSNAPALGKLLQAVTLYGLVDALGGPGLRFARLTAPFQLDDDTLVLRDARAFSPSLGLTAKGRIDRGEVELQGTVVPAYVFNSVLGRIPLIGGLFSAEKGGGVFAMNYSLRGPMDNPSVAANPLSVLTPGILRGMFGLFERATSESQVAPDIQTPLDRPASGGNAHTQ